MSLPGNGIFVVRGEMSTLMTAMRRGSRWNATAYVVSLYLISIYIYKKKKKHLGPMSVCVYLP